MEIQEGFFQVVAATGCYFTRRIELLESGLRLFGPKLVSAQIIPGKNPKDKPEMATNVDIVAFRIIPWRVIQNIDALEPSTLDKPGKVIYESLSGVALV